MLTGARNVGETLYTNANGWIPSGFTPTFTQQWYRDGKAITGATDGTYTQVAADYGHKITIGITSSYPGYTTVHKTSTTSVKTGYPLLRWTTKPKITGEWRYGKTVTADAGAWVVVGATLTFSYQWYEGGKAVAHATHATHTIGLTGLAKGLSVAITAHETGHAAATATSDVVYPVNASFTSTGRLAIVAPSVVKVGAVLKTTSPAWTPTPSTTTYKWYRDGSPIAGATHNLHTIVASDCGTTLSFGETIAKPGFLTPSVFEDYHVVCSLN